MTLDDLEQPQDPGTHLELPKKNRGGAKSKLTDEVTRKFCQAIAAGNYIEAASVYAGVSSTTVQKWLQIGAEQPRSKAAGFRESYLRAQASAEVRIVAQWQQHMPKNWVACAAFLERRYPERWSRYRESVNPGKGAINIQMNQGIAALSANVNNSNNALASGEGRAALVDMLQSMSPEREQALLARYEALEARAGLGSIEGDESPAVLVSSTPKP